MPVHILKPCPCCGSEIAELVTTCSYGTEAFMVKCGNCMIRTEKSNNKDYVVNDWNRREEPMQDFPTVQAAIDWMSEQVDCPFMDNVRVGYYDDPASMATYKLQEDQGCCGYFDKDVTVAGRKVIIGCNYGH